MRKAEIQFRSAMDTAVGLLARRAHTTHELSLKLRKRRVDGEIIARVVAECLRLNYLDDEDTARRYVAELKSKGYGRRHVSTAMRKKGLAADTAEIAMEDGYSHSEEKEIALKMLDKKNNSFSREKDRYKRKSKIYRYLYSRGFSPEVITETVNNTAK